MGVDGHQARKSERRPLADRRLDCSHGAPHTHTLAGIIAQSLGSLTNFKSYVATGNALRRRCRRPCLTHHRYAQRVRAHVPVLLCGRARECMDGCEIWRVGCRNVLGALLGVFRLGSRVGQVCVVCVPQVGIEVLVRFSSTYLTVCSLFTCWSVRGKGPIKIIRFKRFTIVSSKVSIVSTL